MEKFQILMLENLKKIKDVKLILTFSSLKNSNSVNKFKINTKLVIIKKTKNNILKKYCRNKFYINFILIFFNF